MNAEPPWRRHLPHPGRYKHICIKIQRPHPEGGSLVSKRKPPPWIWVPPAHMEEEVLHVQGEGSGKVQGRFREEEVLLLRLAAEPKPRLPPQGPPRTACISPSRSFAKVHAP